jgi:hypothetical protein
VLGARLCLPKIVVDDLLPVVARVMGLNEADTTFLLGRFDPALQEALAEAGTSSLASTLLLLLLPLLLLPLLPLLLLAPSPPPPSPPPPP